MIILEPVLADRETAEGTARMSGQDEGDLRAALELFRSSTG
ncbi:hypothetical protein [Streptomyces vietnamensis]|nr:hypothetical protein [Streptomyces vietnamensis]